MDILNVPKKILFIPQRMFPITALPYTTLAFLDQALSPLPCFGEMSGKTCLYFFPTRRKIRVADGHCPYAMEMLRQDNHGVNIKGHFFSHPLELLTQKLNLINQQRAFSIRESDREKINSALNEISSVICHLKDIDVFRFVPPILVY